MADSRAGAQTNIDQVHLFFCFTSCWLHSWMGPLYVVVPGNFTLTFS